MARTLLIFLKLFRKNRRRQAARKPKVFIRKNEQIHSPKVRLIDENGEQVGVLDTSEARRIAQGKQLDLIEISPSADPPVCRFGDFGSFLFNKQKQEAKQRKSGKQAAEKKIRLRPSTGQHDLNTKLSHAKKFLEKGHPLTIEIFMRGRENEHANLCFDKLKIFQQDLAEIAKVDLEPKRFGTRVVMKLKPERSKKVKEDLLWSEE